MGKDTPCLYLRIELISAGLRQAVFTHYAPAIGYCILPAHKTALFQLAQKRIQPPLRQAEIPVTAHIQLFLNTVNMQGEKWGQLMHSYLRV